MTELVMGPSQKLKCRERVGFASLPDQFVNAELARGFNLNLLLVGPTGIGKSTLIDSLFKTPFPDAPHQHGNDQVDLRVTTYDLQESGVKLCLTVAESIGFGDQLNRTNSTSSIISYLDEQFEKYLHEELSKKRSLADCGDWRVHACLYLIEPAGHTLKSLDLVALKELHQKVNIIPVIAKSDSITKEELAIFKQILIEEFTENGIDIYEPQGDQETSAIYKTLIPFCAVASREKITVNGKQLRVRQYPWGLVEVENEEHSDFPKLREMLLRTHTDDLRRTTHTRFYEAYRRSKLAKLGFNDNPPDQPPVSWRESLAQKRQQRLADFSQREAEIRTAMVQKVKTKEAELKDKEVNMKEHFDKLLAIFQRDQAAYEKERQDLEREKKAWEEQKVQAMQAAQAALEASHAASAASSVGSGDPKDKKDGKDKKKKDGKHSLNPAGSAL
jgi:septin 6/8/11